MPMSPEKIGLAVQKGLSVVCATCERYWEGRDKGLPEPRCATPRPCGSPLAGKEFPEYKGPITSFERWCFVCGQNARYGIRLPGGKRTFALCKEHIGLLNEIEPVGLDKSVEPEVRAARDGDERLLIKVEKKSLAAAIAEVEAHYAKKDG